MRAPESQAAKVSTCSRPSRSARLVIMRTDIVASYPARCRRVPLSGANRIVVNRQYARIGIAFQRRPALERVIDGLGRAAAGGDGTLRCQQPGAQLGQRRQSWVDVGAGKVVERVHALQLQGRCHVCKRNRLHVYSRHCAGAGAAKRNVQPRSLRRLIASGSTAAAAGATRTGSNPGTDDTLANRRTQ